MILNDRNYIAIKFPSVKYGALTNEIEEFARSLYPQFIPEFLKKTLFEMNAGRMINLDLQLETGPQGRITRKTQNFINHYNFQTESAFKILTVMYETFWAANNLIVTFFFRYKFRPDQGNEDLQFFQYLVANRPIQARRYILYNVIQGGAKFDPQAMNQFIDFSSVAVIFIESFLRKCLFWIISSLQGRHHFQNTSAKMTSLNRDNVYEMVGSELFEPVEIAEKG